MSPLLPEEINDLTDDIVSFDMRPEDTEVYVKYIQPLPKGSIVMDFGTGRGKNVIRMALANPEVTIFTIDNARESMDLTTDGYFKEITDRIRKHKANNVYFTLGDSTEVFKNWAIPISILNIDSAHDYETTMKELNFWEPFVIQGGYIFIHDYEYMANGEYRFPELRRAVNEYLSRNPELELREYNGGTQVVWVK